MQPVGYEYITLKINLCGNRNSADIGDELDDGNTARIGFRYPNIDGVGHSAGTEAVARYMPGIGGNQPAFSLAHLATSAWVANHTPGRDWARRINSSTIQMRER